MTRSRRPRARRTAPDVIAALRSGGAVEYTPENWQTLIGTCYFGEHDLTADESKRARKLLDAWREQRG